MIPPSRCDGAACPRLTGAFHGPESSGILTGAGLHSHKDSSRPHHIRDFLAAHFRDYCLNHKVPEEKLKLINAMTSCKTGKLGYTLIRCGTCGRTEMRASSCGSRSCPSCGYLREKQWIALRQAEVIPGIPYFHLVFTLPHGLNGIIYQNQRAVLGLLFRSVKDSVLALSMDKMKMIPGILMVLHSFGSNLSLHYHLHVLVSGGGLSADRKEFRHCPSGKFFLPVKPLAALYRGKFLDGLKGLRSSGRLEYFNEMQKYRNSYVWKELLDSCYMADWNVEVRPLSPVSAAGKHSASGDETTDNAISYFARYTNRTAISDSRVESVDAHGIRFRYKHYSGSSYTMKSMYLSADEFMRRFLMHLLPPGFMRVRAAGFLSGCIRKKSLQLIHTLLDSEYHESPVKKMRSAELIQYFYGRDVTVCDLCHSRFQMIQRVSAMEAVRFIRAS